MNSMKMGKNKEIAALLRASLFSAGLGIASAALNAGLARDSGAVEKHDVIQKGKEDAYIYVSLRIPQRLYLVENGRVIFESPVNAGIKQAPTRTGNFRIFASYRTKTMRGVDPVTGKEYADRGVPYDMYFDRGRAIHGFPRAHYGYPQSFGCVELPLKKAEELFSIVDGGVHMRVTVGFGRP